MENDILFIVQYSEETKQLKLEKIENVRQLPNFSFNAIDSTYNSISKIKSSIVNPSIIRASEPLLYVFNNPFNKPKPVISLGVYYNHYAVNHPNFSPEGWHVPSHADFEKLTAFMGGNLVAGEKLKITGTEFWRPTNDYATNLYNFNLIANGWIHALGFWDRCYNFAYLWALDISTPDIGFQRNTYYIGRGFFGAQQSRTFGLGVRLLKNDSMDPGFFIDNCGNYYNTCKIGDQVWICSNYKSLKYKDNSDIPYISSTEVWAATTSPACSAWNFDLSLI